MLKADCGGLGLNGDEKPFEKNDLKKVWRECKLKAKNLKRDVYILYLALRHPATPWYAKLFIALVVGYALSPIDLIPDFVPVLGYLDDLILIPAGVILALKLIPQEVIIQCREDARNNPPGQKPKNLLAGGIIVCIWLGLIYILGKWIWQTF